MFNHKHMDLSEIRYTESDFTPISLEYFGSPEFCYTTSRSLDKILLQYSLHKVSIEYRNTFSKSSILKFVSMELMAVKYLVALEIQSIDQENLAINA